MLARLFYRQSVAFCTIVPRNFLWVVRHFALLMRQHRALGICRIICVISVRVPPLSHVTICIICKNNNVLAATLNNCMQMCGEIDATTCIHLNLIASRKQCTTNTMLYRRIQISSPFFSSSKWANRRSALRKSLTE